MITKYGVKCVNGDWHPCDQWMPWSGDRFETEDIEEARWYKLSVEGTNRGYGFEIRELPRYGVMLTHYRSDSSSEWQHFNMWIYFDSGRFETYSTEEAGKLREEYQTRNPGGLYEVRLIEEEKKE